MQLNRQLQKVICGLGLLGVMGVVFKDSSYHFDKEVVTLKRQHQSAQRNWNVFYKQQYTYLDSSFRYKNDIEEIGRHIEPNTLLLSDKATSYYLGAQLPVFVANIHRHHGLKYQWRQMLSKQRFCYLDNPDVLSDVETFIVREQNKTPEFKYIVLNRDKQNLNMRYDCLSAKSSVASGMEKVANLVYQGKYLRLYKL